MALRKQELIDLMRMLKMDASYNKDTAPNIIEHIRAEVKKRNESDGRAPITKAPEAGQ